MLANEHEPVLVAVRPLRQPGRRGAVPPVVALADGARRSGAGCGARRGRVRRPARPRPPCRRVLRLVADRARPRLPDLDDVRRGPGAARRRRDGQGVDARGWPSTTYDPGLRPLGREGRRARRHGDDREAGRLGRPGQRDRGGAHRGRTASTPSHGHKWFTSAPMNDVFLVLAQAAGRAHLLPGAAGAARRHAATGWTSYGSRTSWATAPTPPRSWSSTAPGRSGSATRAAACARSSRWSPRPGSTACSARPR